MDTSRDPPSVKVARGAYDALQDLGRGHQPFGPGSLRDAQRVRGGGAEAVYGGKDGWVDCRPELMPPLLRASVVRAMIASCTDPGNPGAAFRTKRHGPRRFQRLEVFVRLKEGADGERVDDAPGQQEEEDVSLRPAFQDTWRLGMGALVGVVALPAMAALSLDGHGARLRRVHRRRQPRVLRSLASCLFCRSLCILLCSQLCGSQWDVIRTPSVAR